MLWDIIAKRKYENLFSLKRAVGVRDWLAENRKLACFRIYIKRSAKQVPGSKNR